MSDSVDKLYCKKCNYKTDRNFDWLKHIASKKHLRDGNKKPAKIYKCDVCDHESCSHWNIKVHKLQMHATKEERAKCKYYCEVCDLTFFCSQYKKSHDTGKRHLTKLEVKKSLDELNSA